MIHLDEEVWNQVNSLVYDDNLRSRQFKAYKLFQIIKKIEKEEKE